VLLFSGADVVKHRFLASKDKPMPPERQKAFDRQLREIGQFAVAPVCRHRLLVEHFGQTYQARPGGCGACDVCLGETQQLTPDEALIVAQKIISTVWRTGGRFGSAHVTQVLLGHSNDQITRHQHEQLSVFGLLAADGELAIRSWIDQLVVQGYLELVDRDQFTFLTMTDAGRDLCRLKTNPDDGVRLGRHARKGLFAEHVRDSGGGGEMFERLRSLRRLLADEQGVPPYVVFTDLTLREMSRLRPASLLEMSAVRGVGVAKLERYGRTFLRVIEGSSPEAALA
jgi:ATP-dependent DNA helicase RecQ